MSDPGSSSQDLEESRTVPVKRSQEAVICRAMSMRNYRRGCADAAVAVNTAFHVVKYSVFSTDKEEARASQCFFSPFMFVL